MCSGLSKESCHPDNSFEYPQFVSLRKEKLESWWEVQQLLSTMINLIKEARLFLITIHEIRNTATDKFAFCDDTLIVAMVTLQEPYFPKHVFSYIN